MDLAVEGGRELAHRGEFGGEDGAEEGRAHDVVVGWGVDVGVDEGVSCGGGGGGWWLRGGGEGGDLGDGLRRHNGLCVTVCEMWLFDGTLTLMETMCSRI